MDFHTNQITGGDTWEEFGLDFVFCDPVAEISSLTEPGPDALLQDQKFLNCKNISTTSEISATHEDEEATHKGSPTPKPTESGARFEDHLQNDSRSFEDKTFGARINHQYRRVFSNSTIFPRVSNE